MESLQNKNQGNQIYKSEYAGLHGAVARSRSLLQATQQQFLLVSNEYQTNVKKYLRSQQVSHISVLCSAIAPTLKKLHVFLAIDLLMELRRTVTELRRDHGYDHLSSTEMEVVLAALTKGWVFPPRWVNESVVSISQLIFARSDTSQSTKFLTRARLLKREEISESERALFKTSIIEVVTKVCEEGVHSNGMSWETVARLASMVDMEDEKHFAARMDGRPDVLLKYGTLREQMQAVWKTFNK